MKEHPGPSLLTLLWLIERRPAMYLGSEGDPAAQLDALGHLITGYSMAIASHGIRDDGWNRYAGFGEYLQTRFGTGTPTDPIRAVRKMTSSPAEAWSEFFRILQEYLDSGPHT